MVKRFLLVVCALLFLSFGVNAAVIDYNYSDLNLVSLTLTNPISATVNVASVGDFNTVKSDLLHIAKGRYHVMPSAVVYSYGRTYVGTTVHMRETLYINGITVFYGSDHATNNFFCDTAAGDYMNIYSMGSGNTPPGTLLATSTTVSVKDAVAEGGQCRFKFGNIVLGKDQNYFFFVYTSSPTGYNIAEYSAAGNNATPDINATWYSGDGISWINQVSTAPLFVFNLSQRSFRIECGSAAGLDDLCTSPYSGTTNPSCSFNGSMGNNDVYCRLRQNCSDCTHTVSKEISGSISVDANVSIDLSVSPANPATSDNLVPSVKLFFPDNDVTVDGNYTWQNRINFSYAWQQYSKAGLSGACSGTNITGLTCTVPTISSSDTNAGNFWRLIIDTNNTANAYKTQATATVGIDTTTDFITNIENLTHIEDYNDSSGNYDIILDPTAEVDDFIFKAYNNDFESITLDYDIYNSLNDLRQYFIYVADQAQYDVNTWVFSDYLTYGSAATYDDPIQKLFRDENSAYFYEFSDSLDVNETKYYKLAYRYPMRYWDSLTHDDWVHQLVPNNYDINGISTDKYSVSVYSNVLSRIKPFLPDVDSNFTYSYELQFNAYVDTAANITVGAWNDTNTAAVNTRTVALTATEKRYSIDIEAGDVNHQVYIKSASTTANNIYFSNVVLIQRAYFKTRLELFTEAYEELPVFITDVNGTSYSYIDEGSPFRFKTQIYDRDGKVRSQKVTVYAFGENDTNKVLIQDVNLVENYLVENTIDLSGLVNGVYILDDDGNYSNRTDILLKIQLLDENGSTFIETGKWIKLHNYPFFQSDFFMQDWQDSRVLNTAPKGRLFIQSRLPKAVESVEQYFYFGNFFCPAWMSGTTGCNAQNTANDVNLAFRYTYYRNDSCDDWTSNDAGCFECTSSDCTFNYNLENKFHFAGNGFHTTFAMMRFNTTDVNTFYSRTVYEIGQQSLYVITEVQGLDANAYVSCDANQTLAGIIIAESTSYAVIKALGTSNPILAGILERMGWAINAWDYFAEAYCGGTGTCAATPILNFSSPIKELLGWGGCAPKINPSSNIKLQAQLFSQLGTEFYKYENIYFKITPCNDDNTTCNIDANQYPNKFYPNVSFFKPTTGANIFIWNTILYDENVNYLADGTFHRLDFYGQDGSLRYSDVNSASDDDGNLMIEIDSGYTSTTSEDLDFLPMSFSAVETDRIHLTSFVNTANKYLDKVEFTIYTEDSSFDELKSDKENQIIKFNFNYEDLPRFRTDQDFNAFQEFNKFKYAHQNADLLGACVSGGGWGGLAGAGVGGGLLIAAGLGLIGSGVGAPAGIAIIGGSAIVGFVSGCGIESVSSWIAGDVRNTKLDANYSHLMGDWNRGFYEVIDLSIENLHVNDYYELLEEHGFDEEAVPPSLIINEIAKKGETAYDKPLTIFVAGKKYELENVLVGYGTTLESVKSHQLFLKTTLYYDYMSKSKSQTLDLGALNIESGNWLADWDKELRNLFNQFPFLILAGVLMLVVFIFVKRGLSG